MTRTRAGYWSCRRKWSKGACLRTSSKHSKWRVIHGHYYRPSCRTFHYFRAAELALNLNRNTVFRLRKTTPPEYPHPRDLLAANPYTPPATLAQSIMHSSPLLSALVVVREWLHDSAPAPTIPGATNGYWRFTRNAVLQGKRTARAGAGLVTDLDPDAVNREGADGKGLTPDDAVRDTILSNRSRTTDYTLGLWAVGVRQGRPASTIRARTRRSAGGGRRVV